MGCRVTVDKRAGSVQLASWFRNIGPWFNPVRVSVNIALFLAFRSACSLLAGEEPPLER